MFNSHLITEIDRRPPTKVNYPLDAGTCKFNMDNIYFLDKNTGIETILQSGYPQGFGLAETYSRLGTTSSYPDKRIRLIKNYYINGVLDWENWEKAEITTYLATLCTYLVKWGISKSFTNRNLKFIKVDNGIDWNYPYTLEGGTIVLSVYHLDKMASARKRLDRNQMDRYLGTLCHEIIHLIQRDPKYRSKFDHLIKRHFGLRLANVTVPANIYDYMVTNPDASPREVETFTTRTTNGTPIKHYIFTTWVFTISKGTIGKGEPTGFGGYTHFMPTMYIYKGKCRTVLIQLRPKSYPANDKEFMVHGPIIPVEMIEQYYDLYYGCTKQVDHPDEAIATLISEYLVKGDIYHGKPTLTTISGDSNRFYRKFLEILGD